MKSCRFCGTELFEDDERCPDCGRSVRPSKRRAYYDDGYDDDSDEVDMRRSKPSGACTASFVLAIIGAVVWLGIFVIVIAIEANGQNPPKDDDPAVIAVGCSAFLVLALNITGIGVGISGMGKRPSNKWMGVVGLIANILEAVFFVVILLIGMAVQNKV